MKFKRDSAVVFIPDNRPEEDALAHITHMGISAHQDDLEIMAIDGILQCFQRADRGFMGVVITDGSGSPRDALYRDYTDEQMRAIRALEQKKAAVLGGYAAQVMLDYPSSAVKTGSIKDVVTDLQMILQVARPEFVYTHNLADKHPTHVATALRVIEAIRGLDKGQHPRHLYGCEVWRDLDWIPDEDKVAFDCSSHENLQAALLGVFDSQVSGGKRYDLGTMGRRRANATYFASHGVDTATGLAFGMDLTPLIQDPTRDMKAYVHGFIDRFSQDVHTLIDQLR